MKCKTLLSLCLALAVAATLSGCTSTIRAIENSSLTTDVKTSESIFLDVQQLSQATKDPGGLYVRVTNTSEQRDLDLSPALKSKLTGLGYRLLPTPDGANLTLQMNVRYLGEKKPGMDLGSLTASAATGALLASGIAALADAQSAHVYGYGAAGGLLGGALNYGVSKAFSVDEYFGVVDVQITEGEKTHKNVIAVSAKQTNLNLQEALPVLTGQITDQVSGLFKL